MKESDFKPLHEDEKGTLVPPPLGIHHKTPRAGLRAQIVRSPAGGNGELSSTL